MKHLSAIAVLFLLFTLTACKNKKIDNTVTISSKEGLIPIDIPSPGYFWMLRSWKDGSLLTMDGKAQFAKITFTGKSGMGIKITPLVKFPHNRIDRILVAMPESDICITQSYGIFHVADISTKKTNNLMLFQDWRYSEGSLVILDSENGIINLSYYLRSSVRNSSDSEGYKNYYNIIYDVKNNNILYESPKLYNNHIAGDSFSLVLGITQELALGLEKINGKSEYIFYNWKKHEVIRNELTDKLKSINNFGWFDTYRNINVKNNILFTGAEGIGKVKITWDENYENVKVIPLMYLFSSGKYGDDFYLSSDGKWATTFVGDYEGLYGETLYKRAFFHLDERYPNGISMPIYIDDYYESKWGGGGAFTEHPVWGMCFAEQYNRENKLYLRLYKMSEVLAEINR